MTTQPPAMAISDIPDEKERIASRQRRAKAALQRNKEEEAGRKKGKEEEQQQVSLGKQQIADSTALLERKKHETWQDLTNIRVHFDDAENKRRIVEENARLDRYETLQIEAVTSGRKNAAVEMKWQDLLNMDIPQDLFEQLKLQKEACNQIIDAKERRIREFQIELRNKDEEYVKVLKQQSEDITTLISKMRAQYHELRDSYEEQLEQIESAFIKERQELIAQNQKEMNDLFDQRQQMEEEEFMARRQKNEREQVMKIDQQRSQDGNEFTKSKIALEKSHQELEQHLEKMMATYQLNKEKLDYNLEVLRERHKEHQAIQNSYKSRLNKLRETKNTLSARYIKLDKKYRQENQELTEEYKRLTKHFKDLQDKFHHFELADEKKFREVWGMNEEEVRGLNAKVLEADRIIHTQQLGLEWQEPRDDQLLQELETFSEAGTATDGKSAAISSGQESGQGASGKFSATKVKQVLDLIKEETAFLLDIKIQDQIAELPAEQADVLKIDAVLRCIGVESQEDVDLLVQEFYKGQDDDDETLMVDPDDVLKILKSFMQEKENQRIADVQPEKKKKQKKTTVGSESEAERKARRRREERKFWERMGHVVPEMNVRVWKALDGFLKKYYDILQRRAKSIDEAVNLQKQNDELKQLLDRYLGSKVNEDLQVPPTHVIRVNPQA
mmetsp:Transcript_28105/g.72718  ORF Transcript_28105/g.72718 Transcript_28105/m.72718 type:complete len:672 (-) Transcript_28105:163-2178(-)